MRIATTPTSRRGRVMLLFAWFVLLIWFVIGPWHRSWTESTMFSPSANAINAARWNAIESEDSHHPSTGSLRAGAGIVDLTQRMEACLGAGAASQLPLAGYGKHVFSKSNKGVADRLRIRALSLDNGQNRLCLVTADLLMVNRVTVVRVMDKLRQRGLIINRDEIVFSATHTHSAYGGYAGKIVEIPSVGWPRPEVLEVIVDAMTDAITEAMTHHVPAEMATCSEDLSARHYIENRIDKALPTNDWLDLLSVRSKETKKSLATLAVFSAHATCHSSHDHHVSGDYPGVLCELLERTFDSPCLFLAGSVGSMKPSDFGRPRSRWSRWLGCLLAHEAVAALQRIDTYRSDVPLGSVGIELKLPSAELKLSRDWRVSPIAAGVLCPTVAYLQGARIDNRVFIATPCDFSGETALRLRDATPGVTTVVTSFNGDYAGYVLPDAYYDRDTYEARAMAVLGRSASQFFEESIEHLLCVLGEKQNRNTVAQIKPSLVATK